MNYKRKKIIYLRKKMQTKNPKRNHSQIKQKMQRKELWLALRIYLQGKRLKIIYLVNISFKGSLKIHEFKNHLRPFEASNAQRLERSDGETKGRRWIYELFGQIHIPMWHNKLEKFWLLGNTATSTQTASLIYESAKCLISFDIDPNSPDEGGS